MTKSNINIISVQETESTNELAKELLRKGKHSLPFVVQTEYQSQGKGQYLKKWESNKGENLLFSLVINVPQINIEQSFNISKIVAVSIRDVLSTYAKNVNIKWPNDIYVGNKKIAGILIENTIIGQRIDSSIIGIGLNVNQAKFDASLPNPISLKQIISKKTNLDSLRNKIVNQIIETFSLHHSVEEKYRAFLYRKGELGQFIDLSGDEFLGVITGIDSIGKLQIRTENNKIRSFFNNEVQFILPETN